MNCYSLTFSSLVISLLLSSCNMDRRLEGSREAVEKMKSMQIKRVTTTQVVSIVDDWGERIVKRAQLHLEETLSNPKTDFAQTCQLEGLAKIDSLEKLYAVEITLLGVKDIKSPLLSAKEREVLDAYLYNAENKISQITNIQKLGDSVLIYNAPVSVKSSICQKCFADDATYLAVWRVKFRRSEVIRKVNAKSLEKIKRN